MEKREIGKMRRGDGGDKGEGIGGERKREEDKVI